MVLFTGMADAICLMSSHLETFEDQMVINSDKSVQPTLGFPRRPVSVFIFLPDCIFNSVSYSYTAL